MDETLVAKLVAIGWSKLTFAVWQRAHYRCEYCGSELLASADVYFFGSIIDHIAPRSGDDLENLVLSCKACNLMKRDEDFAAIAGASTRDELVAKWKEHIGIARRRNEQWLKQIRDLLPTLAAA